MGKQSWERRAEPGAETAPEAEAGEEAEMEVDGILALDLSQ